MEKYIFVVVFRQVETAKLFKKDKWNQKMRRRGCNYVSKYIRFSS